ncbi:MAG: hypothetical protein HOL17_06105 [Gammaproteobacteria bacterium]|nr:hypothetical protein [Thiotrichales bacterium]MBT5371280.1 hypothetical protein [Gammaproteobacteria bacterium]MBT5466478.1 hypothetical protein [Candidatus Neomarinimicrobiota bacterium]MBT7831662.1 hypothetical protein [Candidatus Neomarinimicrobiota bacterium]
MDFNIQLPILVFCYMGGCVSGYGNHWLGWSGMTTEGLQEYLRGAISGDSVPEDILLDVADALSHPDKNLIGLDSDDLTRQFARCRKGVYYSIDEIRDLKIAHGVIAYRSGFAIKQHKNWVKKMNEVLDKLECDELVTIIMLDRELMKEWYLVTRSDDE